MSSGPSSPSVAKAESVGSPTRLKRRHDEMETASLKAATATIPAKRDLSIATPEQSSIPVPSTPATAPGTVDSNSQHQNNGHSRENDDSLTIVDPKVKIEDFAWDDLEQRYHDMIRDRGEIEKGLFAEFESLIKV
jgi:hypothetical protein